MPAVETRYFGSKEYSGDSVLHLAQGLPGFENETAFLLLQLPGQFPLAYLQSLATPDLCFIALPALSADRDYVLELGDDDAVRLGLPRRPRIGREALCLTLIAVDESGPSANLLAPVVVNIETRTAGQCINLQRQSDPESHRARLLSPRQLVTA